MTDQWLSVAHAAELIDSSEDYIYARINDGTLPASDLRTTSTGRPKRRIRVRDLDKFMAERAVAI